MKWMKPLLVLSFIIMAVSCNKKHTIESTAMPEELSALKGKWKVVAFSHDTGWSTDTSSPPLFNLMEFDAKRVSLHFDNNLVQIAKFSFLKAEQDAYYTLRLAGKQDHYGYLMHQVALKNDTLHLINIMKDAGTSYYLVKE